MKTTSVVCVALLAAVAACSAEIAPQPRPGDDAPKEETQKPRPKAATPAEPAEEPPAAAPTTETPGTRYTDACNIQTSACTAAPAGFKEGAGLVAVDRCAFALQESEGLGTTTPELITALETITKKVTLTDVLANTNRKATK